jgi:hypothetical protein
MEGLENYIHLPDILAIFLNLNLLTLSHIIRDDHVRQGKSSDQTDRRGE